MRASASQKHSFSDGEVGAEKKSRVQEETQLVSEMTAFSGQCFFKAYPVTRGDCFYLMHSTSLLQFYMPSLYSLSKPYMHHMCPEQPLYTLLCTELAVMPEITKAIEEIEWL